MLSADDVDGVRFLRLKVSGVGSAQPCVLLWRSHNRHHSKPNLVVGHHLRTNSGEHEAPIREVASTSAVYMSGYIHRLVSLNGVGSSRLSIRYAIPAIDFLECFLQTV